MSFLFPENAAFATRYLTDKIIGVYRGSYSAASATLLGGFLYQYAIPHPFTRPVYTELLWSVDGTTYFDSGSSIGAQAAIAYADASNLYITTLTNVGSIYYKVICSWIDDYDTSNPSVNPVLDTTNSVYFDSRDNYPKIYSQDVKTVSGTSSSTIVHTLTYSPKFKGYVESISGQVWPFNGGGLSNPWLYDPVNHMECYAILDTPSIELHYSGPASNRKVWYRIYYD